MTTPATTAFFAITEVARVEARKTVRDRTPARIPLDQKIAANLTTHFKSMANTFFTDNSTVIPFDGRYSPGRGEVFVIKDFKLDSSLTAAVKGTLSASPLDLGKSSFPQIKAIVAAEVNGKIRLIFQEFKADQIIRQGWALFHKKTTFDMIDYAGITIGNDIDAVYDDGDVACPHFLYQRL